MGKLAIRGGSPVRTKPFPNWPVVTDEDVARVSEVIRSGKWWFGSKVEEFQSKFAAYQGAKYGIAVVNGTAALEVALKAVGVNPGDEVIVPAYTFIATASAPLLVGAVPVFADLDPVTFALDPSKVTEAITPRTKAIIPVHIGGMPANMDAFRAIAAQYHIALIEDAAQAHGAEWKGAKVGSLGTVGTFSFQASKNMSSGEGGIVVTNSEKVADLSYSYHHVGREKNSEWYEHPVLGWNYRLTEIQATLLLSQLERLDEQFAKREENALYLQQQLQKIKGIRPIKPESADCRSAWHLMLIEFDPEAFGGVSKARLVKALRAEGVPISEGYVTPLYKQSVFQNIEDAAPAAVKTHDGPVSYRDIQLPVTEKAVATAMWLPQSTFLAEKEDMDDIAAAFIKVSQNLAELDELAG